MKKLSVLAVALLACSALLAGDCAGTAGTWLSVLPPLVAIVLTLVTREVYSSIFAGILVGAAIATGFSFVETATTISGGFVKSLSDPSNAGILVFLVLLGAIVAMLNKTGASAAFGRWAQGNIRSRTGAQVATACLGLLIFIDDYFNCLAVGSVMRPVTDMKRVSRAKLAYLIDSTAAPICIIAPISSWAAAVAGFASGAGAESGLALFVKAIPYNFYAILTIVTMFMVALLKLDFGPMRKHELAVASGGSDPGAASGVEADGAPEGSRGKVCDLFIPMAVLAVACTLSLVYTGGFFGGKADGDFIRAFAEADASLGLAYGAFLGALFATAFYLSRRVISFRECMAAFPEGFRMMVPAIMILCFAWTLKNITDTLGAREFVSGLVQGSASSFLNFLPAVVFVVAAVLAFATGTSWGTFGVLIPIVLAAVPGSHLATISISACMAGAVCGDHASPISDTTVMASAGAQCNHLVHVRTQLPYVALVAGVSFAGYLVAPFTGSAAIALAVAAAMMLAALFALRAILRRRTN